MIVFFRSICLECWWEFLILLLFFFFYFLNLLLFDTLSMRTFLMIVGVEIETSLVCTKEMYLAFIKFLHFFYLPLPPTYFTLTKLLVLLFFPINNHIFKLIHVVSKNVLGFDLSLYCILWLHFICFYFIARYKIDIIVNFYMHWFGRSFFLFCWDNAWIHFFLYYDLVFAVVSFPILGFVFGWPFFVILVWVVWVISSRIIIAEFFVL